MSVSDLTVECYSGHTYAQEPRALVWRGRRYLVARVEQRWRTPEGPAFQVRTDPEGQFELQYHEAEDCWAIRWLSGADHAEDQEVQPP